MLERAVYEMIIVNNIINPNAPINLELTLIDLSSEPATILPSFNVYEDY